MRVLARVLILVAAVAASPPGPCLTGDEAADLASTFAYLVSQWNANPTHAEQVCNRTLTPDYHDYSDSIRTLESGGCTPDPQPLDMNRYEFILDQATLPPFDFEVDKVWHNCDTITFHWHSAQTPHNVTGIVVLETTPNPQRGAGTKHLIKTTYSEFNTATWLINIHRLTPANCTQGT